tara:strand:+ start:3068 stop:3487 length:420 start_codon:yes stop_codon:yes gene_type:complete
MNIFDWIKQINNYKKPWNSFTDSDKKAFQPYMINRFLSMDAELLPLVNYFQKYSLSLTSPKDVYKFWCSVIPKNAKFNRYVKGKKEDEYPDWLVDLASKHLRLSKRDAIDGLRLINDKDVFKLFCSQYGVSKDKMKKIK